MKLWYIFLGLVSLGYSIQGAETDKCPEAQKQNPTRPCPNNKLSCVRKFFQSNAECQSFNCGNGDVLYTDSIKLYTMFFNLTITQEDVTTTGLSSGKTTEFIVDYDTDLIVLSVKYTNIIINSTVTKFVYYQSGQEPKTLPTNTYELYSSVIITSYFYGAKNPQLENSLHVAFVESLPKYTLGSCITKSKDPISLELFRVFNGNIGVAVQESFQTRSKYFQTHWLQKNICNYGIDL